MGAIAGRQATPLSWDLADQRRAVLAIREGNSIGTATIVSPHHALTCLHVLGRRRAGDSVSAWKGETALALQVSEILEDLDLAVLTIEEKQEAWFQVDLQPWVGDAVVGIGHPAKYSAVDTFTGRIEGLSGDGQVQWLKFKGGQVTPGFSGGPLLNRDGGLALCAIIKTSRDATSDLGGRGIPMVSVHERSQILTSHLDLAPDSNQSVAGLRQPVSLVGRDDVPRYVSVNGLGHLSLTLTPDGDDGLPVIVASADGRVLCTVVGGALEVAWVERYVAVPELKLWGPFHLDHEPTNVRIPLAVTARGELGARVLLTHDASTWIVDVDRTGLVGETKIFEGVATAGSFIRGEPWIVVDGSLRPGRPGADSPAFGATEGEIVHIDVAGPVGHEVLAMLLETDSRRRLRVFLVGDDPAYPLQVQCDQPSTPLMNASIERRPTAGLSLPSRVRPSSIVIGDGRDRLRWESAPLVDEHAQECTDAP